MLQLCPPASTPMKQRKIHRVALGRMKKEFFLATSLSQAYHSPKICDAVGYALPR
jgi:hypothetical protein